MKHLKKKKDQQFIPYGRQCIDKEDIQAVIETLQSDWLTTGPLIEDFETSVREFTGASHAVAVNSGTAALHAVMHALDIKPGDEVILPPITFAATANAVVYLGGTPVFADVDKETLLIDPASVKGLITEKTRAVVAVDYAGQSCDYDSLKAVVDPGRIALISDACHSLGATYKDLKSGNIADMTVFSFHPVKQITTGEGGMITTGSSRMAEKMRRFRNHGINSDHRARSENGSWYYEIDQLGFNYRLTDIQCALGISQMKKLPQWIERRNAIAGVYDDFFKDIRGVTPLKHLQYGIHAYHLYVVQIQPMVFDRTRAQIFSFLKGKGIGVNVHYIPVYYHPFYKKTFGFSKGLCPSAEDAYERIITLPLFPQMTEKDIKRVCDCIKELTAG